MLTLLANPPFHDHAPLYPSIVCCVISEGVDRDGWYVNQLVLLALQWARYQHVGGCLAVTRNAFEEFSTRKRGELNAFPAVSVCQRYVDGLWSLVAQGGG